MSDLINRQAAIDAVLNLDVSKRVSWMDAVIDEIDALPSAQPDVVHCRECVHADKYYHCDYMNTWNHPDVYCYYGKWKNASNAIRKLPSAEKRGRWVPVDDERGRHFVCSLCGDWEMYHGQKYCGDCGARMEESE